MKAYLFTYLTASKEVGVLYIEAGSRIEARQKVHFPCTYKGMTDLSWPSAREVFSATRFQ